MNKADLSKRQSEVTKRVGKRDQKKGQRPEPDKAQTQRVRQCMGDDRPYFLSPEDANAIQGFLSDASRCYLSGDASICPVPPETLAPEDSILFHVREVTYEEEAPWKEALENVLSATRIPGINFLYLLLGDKNGVRFYYGLSRDYATPTDSCLSISELGENILRFSISGNFRGSDVAVVSPEEKAEIFRRIGQRPMPCAARVEGVPGSVKDDERFQSVDRLVDVMQGEPFALLVIAKALTREETDRVERGVYEAYDKLSPALKINAQKSYSVGSSQGESLTEGFSESRSDSYADTKTNTEELSSSSKSSRSTGSSESYEASTSWNDSINWQDGINEGRSWSVSQERLQRGVQEWLKYCDDVILPRLDYGRGKGLFTYALYVMAKHEDVLTRLVNTTQSLYSGKQGNRVPLRQFRLEKSAERRAIQNLQVPRGRFRSSAEAGTNALLARSFLSQLAQEDQPFPLGNWITTNELAMIAGLPRKEVPGMRLREEVEFGLNCTIPERQEDRIPLGNLVQSGKVTGMPVYLDRNALDKHVFVAGVTGSGKTTTCQNILLNSGQPFLVIEPAKSEYRILKNKLPDLLVFTLGDDQVAPFRMNPFAFLPEEGISAHVDMIKASMEAAFDMEAAIPQIIERALYCCYEDYGWDVRTGENTMFQDPFAPEACAFPQLSDLLAKIETVVEEQGFDQRLKNDYIGSIRARLQSLTLGAKGCMLDTKRSIDWFSLLDKQVVFELEKIKSGSEKSLIMGFILTAFGEAVRERYEREKDKKPSGVRHILLVEEAHRLLSKYTPGDSQNKKHGVEMFSDMLAEVRKYGECLIIADQIPNKLAEDVLKNTNTKIVHRIFAQDDKDAIGNTMALSEEQKQFLPSLKTGRAILFSDGVGQATQVQIDQPTDTSSATLSNEDLRRQAFRYYWSGEQGSSTVFLRPQVDLFAIRDLQERTALLRFIQNDIPFHILSPKDAKGWKANWKESTAGILHLVLEKGVFSVEQLARWAMEEMPYMAARLERGEGEEYLMCARRYLEAYIKGEEAANQAVTELKMSKYFR